MYLTSIRSAEVFQALAEPTRLRIVRVLAVTMDETCLCELVDSLLEPQSKLSRHLKILRQAGLLTIEQEGRFVYHRLVSEPSYLLILQDLLRALPDPDRQFKSDLKRFRERKRLREGGRCRVGIQNAILAASGE